MVWRYEPLGSNDIRLLKPLRQPSNDLSFEVVHVSFSSKPHYAALSYTWGPPGDTHSVLLNEQPFPIRENLYDALLQLQNSKLVDKYLWVDAICINQGENYDALNERSVQITLMKQIYEQAAKVFVWLGKPENETYNRLAFQKMKYFKKRSDDRFMKARPYRPWCEYSSKLVPTQADDRVLETPETIPLGGFPCDGYTFFFGLRLI
jgi:Heterokaryon incompatibility protein (HET)